MKENMWFDDRNQIDCKLKNMDWIDCYQSVRTKLVVTLKCKDQNSIFSSIIDSQWAHEFSAFLWGGKL